MAKKITSFYRNYKHDVREGNHGHEWYVDSGEDKILDILRRSCLHLTTNHSRFSGRLEDSNYLWSDGVSVSTVQVTKGSLLIRGETPAADGYSVRVDVETMPPTALLPKELTDLLNSNGFKELVEKDR